MMKHKGTQALLLLILAFSAGGAGTEGGEIRTLLRESDAVILKGKNAGPFRDQPIKRLRVYAVKQGRATPIPFQVDEKNADGDFVFPNGKEKNPEEGDGRFNGNDELVIMARDLGDELPGPAILPAGFDRAAELLLRDPVDAGRGFAYLLSFSGTAPSCSPEDYVNINPATSRISALHYTLGFSKKAPMAMDELRVTPAGGGDNVDYCDRLKARLHVKIGGVRIDKNEEDFTNEMVAWIDGQVRVVRRTRSRLILLWNLESPSAKLDNIYYYNSFSFPTEVYLPIDLGFLVSEPHFRVSVDSPRLSGQRRYRNSLYPEGVIQDGKMSEQEKKLANDPRPFSWSSTGTVGPDGKDHGAWFNRLLVQGDNPQWKPRVFYIDDEKHADPPDEEFGSYGNAGYQISGLTNLSRGVYRLESVMYSVPVFDPSLVPLYMRILDQPLQLEMKTIR